MPIVFDRDHDWLVYDADHVAGHSLHLTEGDARAHAMMQARAYHGHEFHIFRRVGGYMAVSDPPAGRSVGHLVDAVASDDASAEAVA